MKTVVGIIIAGVMIGQLASEETSVATKQHPKKVYVDSVHNKIYWPLEKPFWIRIAESPESNAPSYLLKRDCDTGKFPPGTRLDYSGFQTIRWFNALTKDTERLRFAADGEPPQVSLSLVGPTPYLKPGSKLKGVEKTSGGNYGTRPYYGKGLIGRLTAEDKHSGVEQILVSINNAPFAPASGDIAFTQEGHYTLGYTAVDRVGNAGNAMICVFSVDTGAPATILLSNGKPVENGAMLSPAQTIVFSASDTLSGVNEYLYKFDAQQQYSLFKGPIALNTFAGDKHTVSFYAVDNVGNTEASRTLSFVIDNEPPSVALVFEGDRFPPQGGTEYVSPRTAVRISGNDGKSGLDRIEFKTGGEKYFPYSAPFTLQPQAGACGIEARAFDKAGNVSPVGRVSVKMDSHPPRSRHAFSGPVSGKNDGGAVITNETKIALSVTDNESGVKAVRYRVDNGDEAAYSAPIALSGEGRHAMKYWSIDNVNNREDTQTVVLSLDNTPPKIVETFSVESAGIAEAGPQKALKFPPSTMLFLGATDASGVAGIWYSINGKPRVKYEGNLRFDARGKYSVLLSARDNLGKINEKTVSFEIGD